MTRIPAIRYPDLPDAELARILASRYRDLTDPDLEPANVPSRIRNLKTPLEEAVLRLQRK